MKTPCNECPYRKDSLPGYLGDCSGEPEVFLQQLEFPDMHPCHMTLDWEDSTEEEQKDAPRCIGALQFMNNSLKRHKYTLIARQQDAAGKTPNVFNWKSEFIKHHSK